MHERYAAPLALTLLHAGVLLGLSSLWIPVSLSTILFGLTLALGRQSRTFCWLWMGILLGSSSASTGWEPDFDRVVEVSGRLLGPWQERETAHRARLRTELLRQGSRSRLWRQTISLSMPLAQTPPAESRLRVRGYLKRTPALSNGIDRPSRPLSMWIRSSAFLHPAPGYAVGRGLRDWSSLLQGAILRRLEHCTACARSDGVDLAAALVVGRSGFISAEHRAWLARAGLSHLMAQSGLHLGLVAALIWILFVSLRTKARVAAVLLVCILYVFAAGLRPSLVRAFLMLVAMLGSLSLRRPGDSVGGLCRAGIGMVVLSPRLTLDLGYQMTMAATAGVLLLAPALERRLSHLPGLLVKPISVTLAAQLSTLPITAPIFHLLTPTAPFWNLLGVLWIAAALVLSLIWFVVLLFDVRIAAGLTPLLDIVATPIQWIGDLGANTFAVYGSDWDVWGAFVAAVGTTLAIVVLRPRWLVIVFGLTILGWRLVSSTPDDPQIGLLDVGQGDAVLIRDRSAAILVDGGGWVAGDIGRDVLLPTLASLGIHRLDGAVVTHPDLDHCDGIADLALYLRIPTLWIGSNWPRSKCTDRLSKLADVRLKPLWRGEVIAVGRWRLEALHPEPISKQRGNSASLVLRGSVLDWTVLLTADIDAAVEGHLVQHQSSALADLDILKIAHHGSKTSSTGRFLDLVEPSLALISSGSGNRYGHPSPVVTGRLRDRAVPTLRTDRSGAVFVTLHSNGSRSISMPGSPKH